MFNKKLFEGINDEIKNIDGKKEIKEINLTDKDTVRDFKNFEYVLEYKDLPITVAGQYHAAWWDGFKGIGEPAYYDDKEVKVDYDYVLDWDDFDNFVYDQDETIKLYDEYLGREATDDELDSEDYTNWIFDNAEKIGDKLYDKLCDHFVEYAAEKAEENYEEETDY